MLVLLSFLISRLIIRSGLRIFHSKVFSSAKAERNEETIFIFTIGRIDLASVSGNSDITLDTYWIVCSKCAWINRIYLPCVQTFYSFVLYTRLPTKDETSETTVQNLYCLFLYAYVIPCNYKLNSYFAKSLYMPFKDLN